MDHITIELRDRILMALLPNVAFDGWNWPAVQQAAINAKLGPDMTEAVFPDGLHSVLDHFSDWADRQMLAKLELIDAEPLRVRDRVREAILVRLESLEPWKEAERLAARYWAAPYRAGQAAKILWRTADRIWAWAGDTATDYNRYTKRGLLCGVLTATMVVWLAGKDEQAKDMAPFVERRIDRVLQVGKFAGKFMGRFRKTGARA